jgi:hypothetical protein
MDVGSLYQSLALRVLPEIGNSSALRRRRSAIAPQPKVC